MLTTPYGVQSDDGYAEPPVSLLEKEFNEREFNPNNVLNFDESMGLTAYWYNYYVCLYIYIFECVYVCDCIYSVSVRA